MSARFDRFLSDDIVRNKLEELIRLTQSVVTTRIEDPYAFDIYMRERNKIMIYHGTTCVLVIGVNDGNGWLFSAHRAYGKERVCSEAYRKLMGPQEWPGNSASNLMKDYLEKVVDSVHESKYSGEGLWMNKLGVRFGRGFRDDDPWLIIDRESVIGFENRDEKNSFYEGKKKSRTAFVKTLQSQDPKRWGTTCKSFGDELDFLALDREKNLVCIELKYGGANASEIYWGPLQALLYRDAFKEATTKTVSDGIKKMVEQKVKLRLLPKHALNRLPEGDCDRVRAVLAVADPNPNRRECRNRLTQVKTDLTNEGHDVEVVAIAEDFSIKDYK